MRRNCEREAQVRILLAGRLPGESVEDGARSSTEMLADICELLELSEVY